MVLPDLPAYDLADLSDRAGVSQRTVRYYIQQGLLPAPESRGPGAHYGPEHLDRLRLIRRLQREHLPLAEIRRRLEALGPAEISRLLERAPDRSTGNAKDYIRRVLSGGPPSLSAQRLSKSTLDAAELHPALREPAASFLEEDRPPKRQARSQWDRIILATDVELHVRRPLTREQNRQIERLLDAARQIFDEE